MRGRVSVQIFRLDSDGTLDPNLYTWTSTNMYAARDQVYGAFNFWVSHAAARGITLSFRINIVDPFSRYTRNYVATKTRYEPVIHSSGDDYKWVNDALASHGYGASPVTPENVYSQNEAFNSAHKTDVYGNTYDRSFSVYIAYNPAGASTTFTDGYFAYAMEDGPFTMMLFNGGGWGPANLGKVLTHETAHIFWACDEYWEPQSGHGCQSCRGCFYNVGPRNIVSTPWVTNKNCNNVNAEGVCDVSTACVMKDLGLNAMCSHTPGQVGW